MTPTPKSDLEKALRACKGSFLAVGFFSLFINFLVLAPSFYMLNVYDRVMGSGSQFTLLMLTAALVLTLGTMSALEWVRSRIMVRISTKLDVLLGERLYRASFKQALQSGGNASAQPLSDMTGLRQFLTGNGLFAFFDAPWLPVYIGVMFMFHPWYGWFAIFSAVIIIGLAWANEKLTSQKLKDANKENLATTGFTNRNLRNAEVVESMGMLPQLLQRWQKKHNHVLFLQGSASDSAGSISAMSKTFRTLTQSLVLGLGALLAIKHELSPGLMIAGSILLGRALAPIDLLIGTWKGFIAARGQYERLNELLLKISAEPNRMSLPAPQGRVTAEAIVVAPPGTQQATLRNVSFQVEPGEFVGIIGPSGAGKSSLARALLGIWPAANGKVRLDGADVSTWKREELGPHVGYLPQDIELFEGSISENIARFNEIDPVAVVDAAKIAGVHELILKLPQGYDTVIGASGGTLSGGQRQRIGLARALYRNPKLIVLDEPNSNLDDQGERALASALQSMKAAGSTLFVITHRPSILGVVDKLMVLRDGALVMFGPRDAVLAELQKAQQQAANPQPAPAAGSKA